MSKPEDAPAEFIQVIVRRGHGEEEGHHGGVWKIAYADFMTAMMAFFLVMWLVNASNTEMKSSVASYFNPIKLSDTVIRKKGLMDVDGKANAVESQKARNPSAGQGDAAGEATPLRPGEAVKLGSDESPGKAPEPTDRMFGRDGNADQSGRASDAGQAFRDPFNPFAPGQLMTKEGMEEETTKGTKSGRPTSDGEQTALRAVDAPKEGEVGVPRAPEIAKGAEGTARRAGNAGKDAAATARRAPEEGKEGEVVARRAPDAGKEGDAAARRALAPGKEGEAVPLAGPAGQPLVMQPSAPGNEIREPLPTGVGRFARDPKPAQPSGEEKSGEQSPVGSSEAAEGLKAGMAARIEAARKLEDSAQVMLRDIQTAVKPVAGDGGPGIEVTIEGNGIVLSLTDTSTFGMFSIGSSEPSKQTLELIARIAPVLAANSKRIVVRGHTDSRVYRTQSNNNWRLSVSRAEAAYAMLVRAGIDEARFNRIEGYADRKLKVPGDSEAAANRRIEILLQQVAE